DIYAWNRGRLVLADFDFPRQFRGWPEELRQATRYQADDAVWSHLGLACAILGRRREALGAYRRAAWALATNLHQRRFTGPERGRQDAEREPGPRCGSERGPRETYGRGTPLLPG